MSIDYQPQATATTPTKEQIDEALAHWQRAKIALQQWKDHEQELRRYIVEHGGFFDPTKDKGTETVELGNGYKLKAKKSISYKVANKEGEAFDVLSKLTALGEVSAHKAKKIFRFDAELRLSEYKELNNSERALVDSVLTTKPGMPTLELVEPKAKP